MRTTKHIIALIALGLACAVLLAGAMPAVAMWGDNTYLSWGQVKSHANNNGDTSPHGKYTIATEKCGVCHAVHRATGEALLQTSKANACVYCHVSPGVSTYTVYGGNATNYTGTDRENAHNTYPTGTQATGVMCSDCHQVHGASNKMTGNTYLNQKILKGQKAYVDADPTSYDSFIGVAPLSTEVNPDVALSKWCTRCHKGSADQPNGPYGYYDEQRDGLTHVMSTPTVNYQLGSGETTKVAWASSAYCGACHDSGYRDGSHGWPHFTSGARFLSQAATAGASKVPVPLGQTGNDGVCLKCHRDGTGIFGVGIKF